jgi:hypothetical protein
MGIFVSTLTLGRENRELDVAKSGVSTEQVGS